MARRKYNPSHDPQQTAAYTAEHAVGGSRTFADLTEAQAFADMVCMRLNRPKIAVNAAHHWATSSKARGRSIELLGTMYDDVTVLHELAHIFTHDFHGPKWASCFLSLVQRFMDPAYEKFLESFAKFGVAVDDEVRYDTVLLSEGGETP